MNLLNMFRKSASAMEQEQHALRSVQALEASSTAFMMADANRNIVYANQSVRRLLKQVEKDIQAVLPNFSADRLIGQNIDIFHKNPAHQKAMLAGLTSTHTSSISVGRLNFRLTLTPLYDQSGVNIGTVVEWLDQTELLVKAGMLDALDRSQAIIEFSPDGIITKANQNFLATMGYSLEEIVGQHHRIFVEPKDHQSPEYSHFWQKLNKGEFYSGEIKRLAKGGREVWLQSTYNPIVNAAGKVTSVVKYAVDVTAQKLLNADYAGQIEAISKSQAVIEFNMDGIIQTANQAFLDTIGYTLQEIKGKHHSMFVEEAMKRSHEYREFWQDLNEGIYSTGEYKRVGKGGAEIWLQASYNPILDLNGKPFKVVKYASNVTGRKVAINEVKRVMMSLTEGDLTSYIEQVFDEEFKELGDSINSFVHELHETISQINDAVGTISGASTEIAQGNSDLSNRTEEQASNLEETAASMEEITGTVRLNAENANQANSLASQASSIAVEGGHLIQKVVSTMSSINESARKIADIIGVIDGIAFQTNILALNAAVEAARAGEQGRGFAVVASEVRTLAQRSANAAKDIKELISDSVTKIENGNVLVDQSGETMDKVVTAIKRVNDIMAEIAAASIEQATGIDEVGKAITQMDEMTQQNAALVEEAAAAAESMQAQAEQLASRVAMFKISSSPQSSKPVSKQVEKIERTQVTKPQAKISRAKPASKSSLLHNEDDDWENF